MKTKNLVLCGVFTALIIAGSFIRIPFPGVPMTLQFCFVLLAGILTGPYFGMVSVFLYVILGLLGLPVFASGGGFGYILNPGFGYILGFIPSAFLVGKITKDKAATFYRLLAGSVTALIVTYSVGLMYFTLISCFYLGDAVNLWQLLYSQVLLMLPKDLLICLLCSLAGKKLQFIMAMAKLR